jgi:beta-glucosidase-like glycosyl hydrolase
MRPDFFGSMLRTAMKQGMVPESVVTEKATRVVYSLAAVGALDAPPPTGTVQTNVSEAFPSYSRSILTEIYLCHPCSCHEILRMETPGQVTSEAHFRLARKLASATAILLQNRGGVLPLAPVPPPLQVV